MKAAAVFHPSAIAKDETLRAIADAVLLVNYCITVADDDYFDAGLIIHSPAETLRGVQSALLERYREEMNLPFERFYVSADIGGGNGCETKAKLLAKGSVAYETPPLFAALLFVLLGYALLWFAQKRRRERQVAALIEKIRREDSSNEAFQKNKQQILDEIQRGGRRTKGGLV